MNTKLQNNNLLYFLYGLFVVIIVAVSIYFFWWMINGANVGKYSENTQIGNTYLGGMDKSEATKKVTSNIEKWRNDETIVFQVEFQDYVYSIDKNDFSFDIAASVKRIKEGRTNDFILEYVENRRNEIKEELMAIDFLANFKDDVNYDVLLDDILNDANKMVRYSGKNIIDYLDDYENDKIEISQKTIVVDNTVVVDSLIDKLNSNLPEEKIIINSNKLFSILDTFNDEFSNAELSAICKGMIDNIKSTNFSIYERHYNSTIDYNKYTEASFLFYGLNCKINNVIGNDFSFYNPNELDYYFTVSKVSDTEISISLYGLEFINNIRTVVEEQVIDHITIITEEEGLAREGHNGKIIEVTRVIENLDGEVVQEILFLYEFYPPVKEVEYSPVTS